MKKRLKENTILPVRIENEKYELLRNLAHVNKISMCSIIRKGIDMVINNNKKQLTNLDI